MKTKPKSKEWMLPKLYRFSIDARELMITRMPIALNRPRRSE